MIKLIASDLDGTLLQEGTMDINPEIYDIIHKLKAKGIVFAAVSGREYDSIARVFAPVKDDIYFIAGNGSLIYDIQNDQIMYEKFLNKQKVLEIAGICEENSISYNIYTEETIIAKQLKHNVLYYYKENLKKEEKNKTSITLVEDIIDYIKSSDNNKFLKITICDETKSIFNSVLRKLGTVSDIDILDVSHMSRKTIRQGTEDVDIEYFYTEISIKGADKWTAIEYLINFLNIEKEEVIAIR